MICWQCLMLKHLAACSYVIAVSFTAQSFVLKCHIVVAAVSYDNVCVVHPIIIRSECRNLVYGTAIINSSTGCSQARWIHKAIAERAFWLVWKWGRVSTIHLLVPTCIARIMGSTVRCFRFWCCWVVGAWCCRSFIIAEVPSACANFLHEDGFFMTIWQGFMIKCRAFFVNV